MNREDSLKVISGLNDIIGALSIKWERPQSGAEAAIIQSLLNVRETVRKAHEDENRGLNYSPNTIQWMPGDLVLHDADRKCKEMLMVVTGYDPKTGQCKTRYVTPEAFGWPKRRIYRNSLRVLHDPGRFGIAVPNSVVRDIEKQAESPTI